jgi:hypothetical protein
MLGKHFFLYDNEFCQKLIGGFKLIGWNGIQMFNNP